MTKNPKGLNIYFLTLILFSVLVVGLPYIGLFEYGAEFIIQSRVQMAIVMVLIAFLLLIKRFYFMSVVQILLMLFHITPVLNIYTAHNHDLQKTQCIYDETQHPIRVLTFNIYHKNQDYNAILDVLNMHDAHIVLLLEVQPDLYAVSHESLKSNYPYSYPEMEEGKRTSWLVYSKYPFQDVLGKKIPGSSQRALHAAIDINGKILNLLGLHTQSPKTVARMEARDAYIENLARYVSGLSYADEYIVVAGDFNTTPWHPVMGSFQDKTGTKTHILDNGLGTWPSWLPDFLTIPIDHVFHSSNLKKEKYSKGLSSGSDHYPVYLDFYFCDKKISQN